MYAPPRSHPFDGSPDGRCRVCGRVVAARVHSLTLRKELARVLLERAQDGYVNPTGGKTTGRERKA